VLVDALHGLKSSDAEILSLLRQHAISHQIILSKVDRVFFPKSNHSVARMEPNSLQLDAIVEKLKPLIQPGKGDGPEALGEIIACSAEKTIDGTKIGINNVRWAVLAATGLGDAKGKILPSEIVKRKFLQYKIAKKSRRGSDAKRNILPSEIANKRGRGSDAKWKFLPSEVAN